MKSIRDTASQSSGYHDSSLTKPSFLNDQELKHLILEAANGFLFVVACENGRVVYVTDSIAPVLSLRQEDWIGSSIYDLVHPDDVEKVREQLCGSDITLSRVVGELNFKGFRRLAHSFNSVFNTVKT